MGSHRLIVIITNLVIKDMSLLIATIIRRQSAVIKRLVVHTDYLPSSEDKVKGLMMRHRTLSESNMDLIENVEFMQDEVCISSLFSSFFLKFLLWILHRCVVQDIWHLNACFTEACAFNDHFCAPQTYMILSCTVTFSVFNSTRTLFQEILVYHSSKILFCVCVCVCA